MTEKSVNRQINKMPQSKAEREKRWKKEQKFNGLWDNINKLID